MSPLSYPPALDISVALERSSSTEMAIGSVEQAAQAPGQLRMQEEWQPRVQHATMMSVPSEIDTNTTMSSATCSRYV